MKTIYLLIGPKGSGKTHIGSLIETKLSVKFLPVEQYFLSMITGVDVFNETKFSEVWVQIENEIENYLQNDKSIILESTGTFDSFKDFLERLKKKYFVKLVQVRAPMNTCLERIRSRKTSEHIPMSEEAIKIVNQIAVNEKYDFDLVIDNEKLSDDEIVKIFEEFLTY
ncbi:MAG: AAA family ATPase [Nanoarchaeota archaeon]|nr:AAA family ATPase [Nanoarchaeota archaeon]MBU1854177.1 AAA family ATPase [Nanoarchaeota archaeon]